MPMPFVVSFPPPAGTSTAFPSTLSASGTCRRAASWALTASGTASARYFDNPARHTSPLLSAALLPSPSMRKCVKKPCLYTSLS